MDAVLVLNADLGPLHRVDFRHAIRMLKGDRTPEEAGMRLRVTPAAPSWASIGAR